MGAPLTAAVVRNRTLITGAERAAVERARFGLSGLNYRPTVVQRTSSVLIDPTTGEVRSSSIDDVACWFIDTDYNRESFFVRHAYFTGADAPYDHLKRALKADIDADTWATLYSTVSRPLDPPATGKIDVR